MFLGYILHGQFLTSVGNELLEEEVKPYHAENKKRRNNHYLTMPHFLKWVSHKRKDDLSLATSQI